jgi:hypothetical protein
LKYDENGHGKTFQFEVIDSFQRLNEFVKNDKIIKVFMKINTEFVGRMRRSRRRINECKDER